MASEISVDESSNTKQARDGVARIKAEYLNPEHKRTISVAYLSEKDKKELTTTEDGSSEPPKKKLRGQNKRRPRTARIPKDQKLCFYMSSEKECPYAEKCHYNHDVSDYLAKKPPDIGSECYLFKEYGKCKYGVVCRFGSGHISADHKNIVNEELWNVKKETLSNQSNLTKDVQISLRKRQYDFSKAEDAVLQMQRYMASFKEKSTLLKNEKEEVQNITKVNDKLNGTDVKSEEDNETGTNNSVSVVSPLTMNAEKSATSGADVSLTDTIDSNGAKTVSHETAPQVGDVSIGLKTVGAVTDEDVIKLRYPEFKKVDFCKKLYLSPLTTVGNLPFRRICKRFGADITCGEMAMSMNLVQGQQSEWALTKRHESEDVFGVQISGAHADIMTKCTQLIMDNAHVDFIDINVGCPIDLVYHRGAGCALMERTKKFEEIVLSMKSVMTVPLTAKIRTGVHENKNTAHKLIPNLRKWGVSLTSMHGRSREQRYTKQADWNYIDQCAKLADPMPLFGNGDVLSYEDYNLRLQTTAVAGVLLGRGPLFKPWIFTEIKEQRHWDISAQERFEIVKDYVHYGLDHWGADSEGVEKTRRFLLEWLSFLYRYIPVGLLEQPPQRINERPPYYIGRNDLETMMASPNCADWIKISEMLLGPVPEGFSFLPKHKANSYR